MFQIAGKTVEAYIEKGNENDDFTGLGIGTWVTH